MKQLFSYCSHHISIDWRFLHLIYMTMLINATKLKHYCYDVSIADVEKLRVT